MPVVPPIKSQGIKTKLVDWIGNLQQKADFERWVEPFMGTGVVGFNIRPQKALMCDSNPHLIRFYNAVKDKKVTGAIVKSFLTEEGKKLLASEGEYYYEVRKRFNEKGEPLDFLFLSRSCFNGMMRFNRKGGYNVPFCRKPQRFAQALVTKISNQVNKVAQIIELGDFEFVHQDFKATLNQLKSTDLVYCDPPYIGRHVDYFNSWSEEDEVALQTGLKAAKAQYILSTWLSNKYRTNEYVFSVWKDNYVLTKEHFYHVGGKESNRNSVKEALLSNIVTEQSISVTAMEQRIENGESQLTSPNAKPYKTPAQLALNLHESDLKYDK